MCFSYFYDVIKIENKILFVVIFKKKLIYKKFVIFIKIYFYYQNKSIFRRMYVFVSKDLGPQIATAYSVYTIDYKRRK